MNTVSEIAFANTTGYEDGLAGRPRTTGWRHGEAEAYEAGYQLGREAATVVGGLVGVCVIREILETGERRVEYYNQKGTKNNERTKLDRTRR